MPDLILIGSVGSVGISAVLLMLYPIGLLSLAIIATICVVFTILNKIVNAEGWKLIAKYPDAFSEINPVHDCLVRRYGYWKAVVVQLVFFVPAIVMGIVTGLQVTLLIFAACAPLSAIMFVNDFLIVRANRGSERKGNR